MYTYICTHTHIYICIYIHTHIYTDIIYIYICIHTHTHLTIYSIYIYIYIHTLYIHTYIIYILHNLSPFFSLAIYIYIYYLCVCVCVCVVRTPHTLHPPTHIYMIIYGYTRKLISLSASLWRCIYVCLYVVYAYLGLMSSVSQWPGRPGFYLRSSYTKDLKNGT